VPYASQVSDSFITSIFIMNLNKLIAVSIFATLALGSQVAAWAHGPQQYVIEREMPGVSKLSPEQLREASQLLRELGPDIQWVHSYVAGDKIYCVYNATSEAVVRAHAERAGFPANRITPVAAVISPVTGR
jgi:hypothetical protein